MNKTRERWAKIDAKYVSHKASTAHIQHLIEDAQADIEELYLRVAEMERDAERYRAAMAGIMRQVDQDPTNRAG